MKNIFKRKRNIDKWSIQELIQNFINNINCKITVYIEFKDNGDVILHSNRPGILIGPKGRDIETLKNEIRKYGGKKVTLKEMMYIADNKGLY